MERQRACNRDARRRRRVECRQVRPAAAAAASLLGALALALAHAPASRAAAPLLFSSPRDIDAHGLTALSCIDEARCLAVDDKGELLASANAVAGEWGPATHIDEERALTSVSCTAHDLCVAGDADGGLLGSSDGGASWSAREQTPEGSIASVACAAAECAAVSTAGEVLLSTDPAAVTPTWTPVGVEHVGLRAVSCLPSGEACVAAGGGYADAGAHGAWAPARALDPGLDLDALSCADGESCLAVDEHGEAFASADPTRPGATWSSTPIAALGELDAVSCASNGLCLAAGKNGEALATDDATAATPGWSEYSGAATGAGEVIAVDCLQGGLCVLANAAGEVLTAAAPAPAVVTGEARGVGSGAATLTGSVDANDADLGECGFEYGASTAYGASVGCAASPQAGAGATPVSATVSGLQPNTIYHYRLRAASGRGASAGDDGAFTTEPSSAIPIIHPRPSISGTPAGGSTLNCDADIASGYEARASYQWLRDQVPIPGATSDTYIVRGADSGAHLQCEVTVTDGGGSATATSGFANVPYQSPPSASGESAVGRAVQAGTRIEIPVACAADANAGCRFVLRASTRQQGRTLTLAAASAHLPAKRQATLAIALPRSARSLLAARGRLAATLSVSGTVVGVIEAQLSSQTLLLTEAAARSRKATRRAILAAPLRRNPAAHAGTNASPAAVRPPALSPTPYMGWDTYFAFGGHYDETTVLQQASQLITLGLAKLGYRYVWLDVGWWHGARSSSGQIQLDSAQWPHGMRWLADTLHAAGLRVGLYTDAGPNGCGGIGEGSYGHYQQDVDTFAAWRFDAVKVDFCGGAELHLDPASAYSSFHEAIAHNSSRRPMLLDVCDFLQPDQYTETQPTLAESAFDSYLFGPSVATSWRTDTDVGTPHDVTFADVLRNMDADAAAPQAAGPGHWNDPDYLAPDQGMSAAQFRTQFSMWSILAAPLMISDNLDAIGASSLQTVRRAAVIAVDQDRAGRQGTLLSSSGDGQVWVKPLAGGDRALALLNRGSSRLLISTSTAALAMRFGPPYQVSNLYSGAVSFTSGAISAEVPAQSTVLLRVSAG